MSVKELVEVLNKRASKLHEVISEAREKARSTNTWVNLPLYRGTAFNAEIAVSPNGTAFFVIRGAKVKNKMMAARAETVEEMITFIAALGNSKFYDALLEVLRSNPTNRKGVVIEW